MISERKQKSSDVLRLVSIAIAAGAVLMLIVYLLMTNQILSNLGDTEAETMTYMKERIDGYSNYVANDETKSLVRLVDKATELSNDLTRSDNFNQKVLERFSYEQRLDGILVLDASLKPVLQTSSDGDSYEKWKTLIESGSVSDIAQHPEKAYMVRTEQGGDYYDFAAISRRDTRGVLICYTRKNMITEGANDISLDMLFDDLPIRKNGVIVVTDGENVLTSNDKRLHGKSSADSMKLYQGVFKPWRYGLIRLQSDRQTWYGGRETVNGYTLYAFFPAHTVFLPRTIALSSGTALYVVLLLLFLLFRSRTEHMNLQKLENQYRLVDAIGSIYRETYLVDLQDYHVEIIKGLDDMRHFAPESWTAQNLVQFMAQQYVMPAYREKYLQFFELDSIAERVKNHRMLGYNYESVNNTWLLSGIIPQRWDQEGNVTAVLFVTRNVSEDKQRELDYQERLRVAAEQEKRANIAKTDFLRRMSHDIRTPINGIRGMVKIADRYADDLNQQAKCRKKIWETSGFLLDLVNNVLDMNKLESGEIKLAHESFDLCEMVDNISVVAQVQATEFGVTYHYADLQVQHKHLLGSPVHLRQILQNLISNAMKYNREGGEVWMRCREITSDADNVTMEFICEDNGIGMSEEFQAHAFEPFTQENARARTAYTGTGLGLAITRELVECMGGTIHLESAQGKGTRFTIQMRFQVDKTKVAHHETPHKTVHIQGMHILIAEDNELNMEIAEFMLGEQGAILTKAWNGEEALQAFVKSPVGAYDIILMDIMMPVMGGLQAAREIRQLDRPDAKTVPIFAMTANAFSDDKERSRQAGMNEHLTKPLDTDTLIRIIAKYQK